MLTRTNGIAKCFSLLYVYSVVDRSLKWPIHCASERKAGLRSDRDVKKEKKTMQKIILATMAIFSCIAFANAQAADANIAGVLKKPGLIYDGPAMKRAVDTLTWPARVCAMDRSCVRDDGKRAVFSRGSDPEVERVAAKIQDELQINGGPVKIVIDGWETNTLIIRMSPAGRPDLYVEERLLLKKSASDVWADFVATPQNNGCASSSECWPKQMADHQRLTN